MPHNVLTLLGDTVAKALAQEIRLGLPDLLRGWGLGMRLVGLDQYALRVVVVFGLPKVTNSIPFHML